MNIEETKKHPCDVCDHDYMSDCDGCVFESDYGSSECGTDDCRYNFEGRCLHGFPSRCKASDKCTLEDN